MSICSPVHVELPDNQFLADLLTEEIKQGNTLIVAPTGAGKSTYFMEKLRLASEAQDKRLLILSPLTAQVMQLEVKYPSSEYPICFMYGTDQPTTSFQGKHIVATYDKFARLRYDLSAEQRKKYILVVDEYHKLYSAGHFRDAALNPILKALQRKYFAQNLFFTATFTQHLATHLPHPIHYYQKVVQSSSLKRSLCIINYKFPWSYHWLMAVENHLKRIAEKQKETAARQTVLVRLNSLKGCQQAEHYLRDKGYKVLYISRQTAYMDSIQNAIRDESLPVDFDVILTTSLLDEAVNFHNQPIDIESVHLVNATASPEEIIQFMGRLRRAAPPCFLHLQHGIARPDIPADMERMHQETVHAVEQFYGHMKSIADNLAFVLKASGTENIFGKGKDTQAKINMLNTTFAETCGCNVLSCEKDKVVSNVAGITAAACQMDLGRVYQDADYLEYRLKLLNPDLTIRHISSNNQQNERVNLAFDSIKKRMHIDRDIAVDIAFDDFMNKVGWKWEPLKHYGARILEQINDIQEVDTFAGISQNREMIYSAYRDILWLTQHVDNLKCIYKIVRQNDTSAVIKAAKGRQQHVIIQALKSQIEQHMQGLQQQYGTFSGPLKISGRTAKRLLEESMDALNQQMSLSTILQKMPLKGVKVRQTGQGDCFTVAESKALLLMQQYFNVRVGNSHKQGASKFVEFLGFGWGGYHYYDVEPSPTDLEFEWDGRKYNARSGHIISNMTVEDLYKL